MAKIGCFSYSGVGHVSPLLALARRLQARGHDLTFFQSERMVLDLALNDLTASRLRAAILEVLTVNNYRQAALRLQQTIREADGLNRAADVIEVVIKTGRPVLRETSRSAGGKPG